MIPEILQFVLQVGSNKELDLSLRQQALNFVEWVLRFKPKSLIKHNLIASILQVIFPMCAEPEEEGDEDEDSLTAHQVHHSYLISFSLHLNWLTRWL